MLSALRADLHNTAGKSFIEWFKATDFMPGAKPSTSIEDRARELMEQGYDPAAAVAMASSTQTKEHGLHIVESELRKAEAKKRKEQSKPVRSRLAR